LGFLGTLHMDVFRQRLEDEYDANVIITAPTVPYKIIHKDRTITISNPIEFPDVHEASYKVVEIQEPVIHAKIIVPQKYLGEMMSLCTSHRAETIEHKYLSICTDGSDIEASRVLLTAKFPLSEVVTDFHDSLKHLSSGYASFDYEDAGYETCDMKKMTFLLNGKPIDALAMIVHNSAVQRVGRAWTKKLKEVIPRHLFEVVIQAAVGSKVIARETLSAMRKDVTAGLYGGHYERKLKHLNRQKEGKKKMKRIGNIELPQAAFYEVLSTRPQK